MKTDFIKKCLCVAALMTAAQIATAEIPRYNEPELVARANGYDSYNLPSPSYLNSTSPALGDDSSVAFKLMAVYDRGNQAMWYKGPMDLAGKIVYEAPENKYVSDGQINASGELTFSVFDEVRSDGVFVYNPLTQTTEKTFSPKGTDITYFGDPQRLLDGSTVFRATTFENDRRFYILGSQLLSLAEEGESLAGLQLSYLFGPTISHNGKWAFKARLGEKKDWAESAADRILLLAPTPSPQQGPAYELITVAEDKDSNAQSAYEWFGNVVSLSNDGHTLVFVARENGKKVIVQVQNGQSRTVAAEGRDGLTQIEPFNPKVNNNGLTVFRAKNEKGLRGVYLADGRSVRRLVGEGDMVISDLGKSIIMDEKSFPGLAGDVDINNKNEILFSCVLKSAYGDDKRWGSAIYLLKPAAKQESL